MGIFMALGDSTGHLHQQGEVCTWVDAGMNQLKALDLDPDSWVGQLGLFWVAQAPAEKK